MMLALIPARGGSKGLPGKNVRPFAGLPLIAHSILLAKMCPEIDRLIVSTDSPEIAAVACEFGADVPFERPARLARDETPTWPVLRHALQIVEEMDRHQYEYLLLLEPTSPVRLPDDVGGAYGRLVARQEADGIIGVSRPEFNPRWVCVIEQDGWMADLVPGADSYDRRQDVPAVYRINGSLYIWRTDFVRREPESWRRGRLLAYEVPESRAVNIDNEEQFARAALLVEQGLIRLPWMR